MMMGTGQIQAGQVVVGAILSIAMTRKTARVRRTHRPVRKAPAKWREQWIGRGKGRGMRTQWRKGRGRKTVKGKVLLNEPQGEKIFLMPLLCSCRRK
jgi:hypothetical protein